MSYGLVKKEQTGVVFHPTVILDQFYELFFLSTTKKVNTDPNHSMRTGTLRCRSAIRELVKHHCAPPSRDALFF